MEDFRKAMYAACRQMDLEIVPIDTGARVMAFIGLQGRNIRKVCDGERHTCGGYCWKWDERFK